METVFLACLLFGAVFTVASLVLGFAGSELAGIHAGHAGAIGHGGPGAHGGTHPGGSAHADGRAPASGHAVTHGHHLGLPLFSVSSLLAFVTWFGAGGYILTRFAGWPAVLAIALAVVAGAAGSVLVAAFLRLLLAGEREMDPREYRLEGTIARVSVGIPAAGTGEIVFTKAGSRRSEAARSLSSRAIPRDTEVVIIDYEHGVASVQPWAEFVGREDPSGAAPGAERG